MLLAVGRRPYTEGLNLEAAGIEKDNKGRIVIDDQFNTSVKGIKCIGDVTFGPMLAHKAEEEGQSCSYIILLYHADTTARHRRCGTHQIGPRTRQLRRHPIRRLHPPRSGMGR